MRVTKTSLLINSSAFLLLLEDYAEKYLTRNRSSLGCKIYFAKIHRNHLQFILVLCLFLHFVFIFLAKNHDFHIMVTWIYECVQHKKLRKED